MTDATKGIGGSIDGAAGLMGIEIACTPGWMGIQPIGIERMGI